MTLDPKKLYAEYLGDGVYASFDGYQIWLSVNDHRNKVVALEGSVMLALIDYNDKLCAQLNGKETEKSPNETP